MRKLATLSLLAAAGMCCFVFAQEPDSPNAQKEQQKPKYVPKDRITSAEHKVSNERIDKIQTLLKKYYDERKDLEDPTVINDLKREMQAFVPVVPQKKADTRSLVAIKGSIQAQVNKKFSGEDKLKKTAASEAKKKYPMVTTNQQVKVFYKRGRSTYTISGRFYGFGLGGKSVKINSRTISFYDLLPESKAMFDKKINADLRSEYVKNKLRGYQQDKLRYSEKLFAQEYAKVRKGNEKLGYIYQNGTWVTGEMILKQQLPEMIRLAKERAEKERLEKEAREKAKREAGGNAADEQKKDDEGDEGD